MCEICAKRKADVALFLSEHAPQLGIQSARAQVAWSDLNALCIEVTQLPEVPSEQLHAQHEGISQRMQAIMESLSLFELEQIHFAAGVLWLTGNVHRNNSAAVIEARWRAGERDPELSPEAVESIEAAVRQGDFANNLRKGITDALTQVFEKKGSAPGVTVFVPGNGKPVPPA
jgi:hypothetical protein